MPYPRERISSKYRLSRTGGIDPPDPRPWNASVGRAVKFTRLGSALYVAKYGLYALAYSRNPACSYHAVISRASEVSRASAAIPACSSRMMWKMGGKEGLTAAGVDAPFDATIGFPAGSRVLASTGS